MRKNKKGWIEIIEAFISMILISAVILILLNQNYSNKEDISESVYNTELAILREIQFNMTLREAILSTSPDSLPISQSDDDFPTQIDELITRRVPDYLTCIGLICDTDSVCIIENLSKKDVYAQSVIINPTLTNPDATWRRMKLFCYSKNE